MLPESLKQFSELIAEYNPDCALSAVSDKLVPIGFPATSMPEFLSNGSPVTGLTEVSDQYRPL
jgi:hypothetical protein